MRVQWIQLREKTNIKSYTWLYKQKQILADAGNDPSLMVAESAFPDTFDANRILYRRVQIGNEEVFEYSTNENDELFNVTFTNVGTNQKSV